MTYLRKTIGALIVLSTAFTFEILARENEEVITNDNVIKMIEEGIPKRAIVANIGKGPIDLDTSLSALIDLKKKGATQEILNAVFSYTPADQRVTGVFLIDGEARFEMTAAGMGNFRGSLSSPSAALRTENARPEFEVGVPEHFQLQGAIALARLWVVDKGKATFRENFTSTTIPIDLYPVTTENTKDGRMLDRLRIVPSEPLGTGEYVLTVIGIQYYDFGID